MGSRPSSPSPSQPLSNETRAGGGDLRNGEPKAQRPLLNLLPPHLPRAPRREQVELVRPVWPTEPIGLVDGSCPLHGAIRSRPPTSSPSPYLTSQSFNDGWKMDFVVAGFCPLANTANLAYFLWPLRSGSRNLQPRNLPHLPSEILIHFLTTVHFSICYQTNFIGKVQFFHFNRRISQKKTFLFLP